MSGVETLAVFLLENNRFSLDSKTRPTKRYLLKLAGYL